MNFRFGKTSMDKYTKMKFKIFV